MNLNLIDVILDVADTDYNIDLDIDDQIEVELTGDFVFDKNFPRYEDSYHITPAAEEQVLQTKDKVLIGNLVVEAIPSNYGLITWNGSTLTVS